MQNISSSDIFFAFAECKESRGEGIMDLEYYRHRQQESQVMSQNAACDCSRLVHRRLADAYALLVVNGKPVPGATS